MEPQQATQVLTMLEAAWPKGPWPEDTENLWLMNLVSFEFGDAQAAVQWLLSRQEYTPTMAHWSAAIGQVRADARRRSSEAEPKALPGPATGPMPSKLRAALRKLFTGEPVAHNHHPRKVVGEDGQSIPGPDGEAQFVSGPAACPVCSKSQHDHTDQRIAGYDRRADVRCFEITCPVCGDPDTNLDSWTPAGVEAARSVGGKMAPSMATQEGMDF